MQITFEKFVISAPDDAITIKAFNNADVIVDGTTDVTLKQASDNVGVSLYEIVQAIAYGCHFNGLSGGLGIVTANLNCTIITSKGHYEIKIRKHRHISNYLLDVARNIEV